MLRQVEELHASNANLSKARGVLQQKLDDAKAPMDEESLVSVMHR